MIQKPLEKQSDQQCYVLRIFFHYEHTPKTNLSEGINPDPHLNTAPQCFKLNGKANITKTNRFG